VVDGAITGFDAGVFVEGGQANERARLLVLDNGTLGDGQKERRPADVHSFGDGIVLNSDHNLIHDNRVAHNGPNDGIGLFANSGWNTVHDNVVADNDLGHERTQYDDGIRVESGAHDNLIAHNIVERNGRTGIAVFAYGTGSVIRANIVRDNGRSSVRRGGNGIRVNDGAAPTEVRGNSVFGNLGDGIRIDGQSNLVSNNDTGGNGAGGAGYDLHDTNRHPRCDGNTWRRSTFHTAFPLCAGGSPIPTGRWSSRERGHSVTPTPTSWRQTS
jgi:hypothetical protein